VKQIELEKNKINFFRKFIDYPQNKSLKSYWQEDFFATTEKIVKKKNYIK
jgi:hypothetical protein